MKKDKAFIVICDKCGKALKKAGALIFSPPTAFAGCSAETNDVLKFHICRPCYSSLCNWLEREGD